MLLLRSKCCSRIEEWVELTANFDWQFEEEQKMVDVFWVWYQQQNNQQV